MKLSVLIPIATASLAIMEPSELPVTSLVIGGAAFVLTRVVVGRNDKRKRKTRWYEDAALMLVLLLGLFLAISGQLFPEPLDRPLAPGTAFLLGVGVGWGGFRSLEIIGRAGQAAWKSIVTDHSGEGGDKHR